MNGPGQERGAWLDDLAIVAAGALRTRTWLVAVGIVATLVLVIVGPRATSVPVAVGWVGAGLLAGRGAPATGRIGVAKCVVAAALAALLASAAFATFARCVSVFAFLDSHASFRATVVGLVGVALAASARFAATPPLGGRSGRIVSVFAFATGLAAVALVPRPDGWNPTVRPAVAEFLLYVGLALVTTRRRPLLVAAIAAVALTAFGARDTHGGPRGAVVVGPLLVVLCVRIAHALRAGADAADAAAARLAQRIVWRPWRATIVLLTVAGAASFDFYTTAFAAADAGVPAGPSLLPAFFATPGLLALGACVLFHALLPGRSPFELAAPLAVPVGVVCALWLGVTLWGGGLEPGEVLPIVVGLGPLLPVLVGAAAGRGRSRSDVALLPVLLAVAVGVLVVVPCTDPHALEELLRSKEDRALTVQLTALTSIVWALLWHRLVVACESGRALLWGGLVWAALTALALGRFAPAIALYGSFRPDDARGPVTAVLAFAFFGVVALYTVAAVALARRFRDMTVLPADHAVVLWEDATRSADAAVNPA